MAKKVAEPKKQPEATISKMGAIRQLLATGLSNPTEIAAQVRAQYGLDVKPSYVSTVKTILKSKSKAKTRTKTAKKAAPPDRLDAAVDFCEGVGGVEAAKILLEKIERIKNL